MYMKFIGFVLIISVFCGGLLGMHYLAYRPYSRVYNLNFEHWKLALLLLALSYFLASIGVRFIPNLVTRWFYILASVWLGVLVLLFSTSLIYELIRWITKQDHKILLQSLLVLTLLLSIYGIYNAHRLTITRFSISLPNLVRPLKIVQLSDIHVGTVNRAEFLERIVSAVNQEQPDLVMITGDMFDGSSRIDLDSLAPLDNIAAKTYFSIGNHEIYENLDRVRDAISHTKIELLENKKVEQLGIQIVGVNDPQERALKSKLGSILRELQLDPEKPTILMYHPPHSWQSARDSGVDLMLSGHTHNGQIFPFNLVVKAFYPKIYGLYMADNKYLYTTSGTGTWGPPMRIGSNNEIVVITLVPLSS